MRSVQPISLHERQDYVFWKNLIRFIGALCLVAIIVGLPVGVMNLIQVFFFKNIILTAVGVVAVIGLGCYSAYLVIRYMIIQYFGQIFGR